MQDIDGAAKFLASKSVDRKYCKEIAMQKQTFRQTIPFQDRSNVCCDGNVFIETSIVVKWTVHFSVNNSAFQDLNTLGLTNLSSVTWEVIPYSFVVDWFLPIGNFLNNYDAFAFLNVESICKTVMITEKIHFSGSVGGPTTDGWNWSGGQIYWRKNNIVCYRETPGILPDIPIPRFKDGFSPGHIANAIALLSQLR
jgi:hypothetical protein